MFKKLEKVKNGEVIKIIFQYVKIFQNRFVNNYKYNVGLKWVQ